MSFQNLGVGELFVASVDQVLNEVGITLQFGDDQREFASITAEARPDHQIAEAFDPEINALDKADFFWVVGRDQQERLVHAQALRHISLENKSLADYLSAKYCRFAPAGLSIDEHRSSYRPGPGSSTMRGSMVYHGEFWVNSGLCRRSAGPLSSALCRRGFWEAFQKWSPDAIFCFMANQTACKGFAARAGWTHMEPGAIRLVAEDTPEPVEGFLVYILKQDIDYILGSLDQLLQRSAA